MATPSTFSVSCNNKQAGLTPLAETFVNHVYVYDDQGALLEVMHCSDGISNYFIGSPEISGPQDIEPTLAVGAIGAGFFVLLPLWAAVYGGRKLYEVAKRG